jgi:hypothetical protein
LADLGDFNLVRAALKLNRRGEGLQGFAKLFQTNVLGGETARTTSKASIRECDVSVDHL